MYVVFMRRFFLLNSIFVVCLIVKTEDMRSLYIHRARQYPTIELTASDSTFEPTVPDSIQPKNLQHPTAHSNLQCPTVSNHRTYSIQQYIQTYSIETLSDHRFINGY